MTSTRPTSNPVPRRGSLSFFGRFFFDRPGRTVAMVVMLTLAGLSEGFGLVTMLPLLELTLDSEQTTPVSAALRRGLAAVGLEPTLGTMLLMILVAMTAKGVLLWFGMREVGYTVAGVAADLRLRLLAALVRARYAFFHEQPGGHIVTAAATEARRAAWAYRDACHVFADSVQAAAYICVIFLVDWRIALLAPLVGGLMWLVLWGMVRLSRRAGLAQTQAMQGLVSGLSSMLPNIKSVKAMARESRLTRYLDHEIHSYERAERNAVMALETSTSFREPIIVLAMVTGLYFAMSDDSSLQFTAVVALAIFAYRTLLILGRILQHYQSMVSGEAAFWSLIDQIEDAEAAAETLPDAANAPIEPLHLERGIVFDGVSFGYEEHPILHDVSLDLPAHSLVTLCGPSGSGKTTLVDLLVGLMPPDEGRILIDGRRLDEVDIRSWRRTVGYVPQELMLFPGTVAENVTLGDDAFTREEVERALRAAGCWDFVASHPDGLDRKVGEGGRMLSGGQGQRLMLARALVHRPQLLILDEATTGLDPATEDAVCTTVLALRNEMTILAISHQPRLREVSDVVVRVEGGRVVPLEDEPISETG